MWLVVLCVVASYLLGGVPFGLLLGKFRGVDIRTVGSRNIGATNLTRALGRSWGVAAFLLDFLKGLLPVLATALLLDLLPEPVPNLHPVHAQILAGLAAVLGHVFPIYLRFRGGKGVATSFGVMAGLLPVAALISGGAWVGMFLATRIVSVASIVAAVLFPISVLLLYRERQPEEYFALEGLAIAAALLILVRHHANVRRLLTGKERRF